MWVDVDVWQLRVVQCSSAKPGIFQCVHCTECIMKHNLYWMRQRTGSKWRLRVFGGRGRGLCVFVGLCVDMWRLVHQRSFLLFWLSFDCFWRLVHCWYSLGRPVTIGTPMVKNSQKTTVYQQCTNRQKTAKMTVGVPIVTCLHRVRRIHKVRVRVRRPRPHPRPHPRPPNTQSPSEAAEDLEWYGLLEWARKLDVLQRSDTL